MKLLAPLFKKKLSEAEIQSELYHQLKELGFTPRMSVPGYITPSTKCLFDIVLFTRFSKKATCIIECKRGSGILKNGGQKNKDQYEKYCKFGLPVLMCGKDGIEKTINTIRSMALER